MNRMTQWILIAAIMFLPITATRGAAQTGDYWMEFAFLIPDGDYSATDTGCTVFPDAFLLSVNVVVTPYAPEGSFLVGDGRIVTGEASPVPGQPGCVLETIVTFPEFQEATFTFEAAYLGQPSTLIDLGTVTWADMPEYGRGEENPTIFILDGPTISSGVATPFVPSDTVDATPTPDLMATIEAQQAEIESLKATIEALQTPAP